MHPTANLQAGSHEAFMREALRVAEQAIPVDVPVGAVLVYEGGVIAEAFNERELHKNPVGHAEILILQHGAAALDTWRLSDTTLYVTLEPCPMCASAIQQARVGQVVFGAYDPVMGACGSTVNLLPDTPETRVLGGVLEEECSQRLKDFFVQMRQNRDNQAAAD